MYKHTIKDFLDGSICVRCNTSEDKQRLLQLCTEAGITKTYSSLLDIQQIVWLNNVFYVDQKASILAAISKSTSKFCDAVPFSSLSSNARPRRIVIDYSDTITTATLYNGEKAVKSATINRRPSDTPSVHVAAIEAIDKLLAKQVKQPKPKKPAEKNGFKVGDRVIIDAPKPGTAHKAHGKHGTIVSLENEDCSGDAIAVELDEPVYLHNCNGQTKPGHGCYVEAEQLRHEQPDKQKVREVKRHAAEKNGFKVGDRVVCTDPRFECSGKHGRVAVVDKGWGANIGVEFDEDFPHGNSCGGKIKSKRGYWLFAEFLSHEQPTKPQVREVKRHAKVGEWVKIVDADRDHDEKYANGDVLRVLDVDGGGWVHLSCGGVCTAPEEYVVLEGYHPEEHANA